ncbi:hypothetical protein D3C72_1503010 [compost metagenome]
MPMPMPASAITEPSSRVPTLPALERSSRPVAAISMASSVVRSRPRRRASAGVATPNNANEAVGSMPSTPVMVVPKPNCWPSTSSSGVIEVTAVRRLTAASRIAANASRRPCSNDGEGEVGDVMRCSLQVAHAAQVACSARTGQGRCGRWGSGGHCTWPGRARSSTPVRGGTWLTTA